MPNKKSKPGTRKKNGRGFVAFPKTGRKRCIVYNQASPGDQVEACLNGVNFVVQHGATVDLHPSQIKLLKAAVINTTKFVEDPAIPGKFTQVPEIIPRVMVEVLGDTPEEQEAAPAIPPKEQPSWESDPRMVSGRG